MSTAAPAQSHAIRCTAMPYDYATEKPQSSAGRSLRSGRRPSCGLSHTKVRRCAKSHEAIIRSTHLTYEGRAVRYRGTRRSLFRSSGIRDGAGAVAANQRLLRLRRRAAVPSGCRPLPRFWPLRARSLPGVPSRTARMSRRRVLAVAPYRPRQNAYPARSH